MKKKYTFKRKVDITKMSSESFARLGLSMAEDDKRWPIVLKEAERRKAKAQAAYREKHA